MIMISRITRIGVMAAAFIIIAGVSAYLTLTFMIKQRNTVIVPDLVGKDVVDVLFLLTDLGLNTKVRGAEYRTDIPVNHVVFQDPGPGDEIKKDRDVRIVISKGPKTVQTPNLEGLPVSQARIILEENGLCLGNRSYVFSRRVRKDGIVAHTPAPGRILSKGNCVDLLISNGMRPAAYKMPDLEGQALEETLLLFETADFRLGNVRTVSYKNKPWNSIVEQEPLPGHRVTSGHRVDLSVNRAGEEPGRESSKGLAGARLFRYRASAGYLKRRIRVRLNGYGGSIELYDDFLKPGDEIWHLIPENPDTNLFLYEDGKLVPPRGGEWESAFGFSLTDFDFKIPDLDMDEG